MDAIIATGQKYWTSSREHFEAHWRAIASIVIFVVTLYAVWGKIALVGMVVAGGLAYHYKLPVISYVEMFELKGVALSAATLVIPTLVFPFNYMAASAISVAYLAHEREAMQARAGLQGVIETSQKQIEELQQLALKCSEMCTEFEATITRHTQTNTQLEQVQTTAGEVRLEVQEQTQQILARMQELRQRLSSNTDLQQQMALQAQLSSEISTRQSQLASLQAQISTIEQQILPKLQGLVGSLTVNEHDSTTCVQALRNLLAQFTGDTV